MKRSGLVALSAIAVAFSVILLSLGAYVPVLEYSAIFMASLCVMLPLSKKSIKAALLTYVATSLLSALLIGGRWEVLVPYVVFFGLHPIVNRFLEGKKVNRVVAVVLKDVWFVGTLLLVNLLFVEFFAFETEWAQKYIVQILAIGGALIFIVYDFLACRFQRAIDIMVARLRL